MSIAGLSNTDRIELLLNWWSITEEVSFAKLALSLANKPVEGLDSWRDGDEAIELIYRIRDGDYYIDFPFSKELTDKLELAYIAMLERGVSSEDVERISDAVENYKTYLGDNLIEAVNDTICQEFEHVNETVSEIDSESTLDDHITTLRKLAERTQLSTKKIENAIDVVQSRIIELQEEEEIYQARSPVLNLNNKSSADKFDDTALNNLFAPLLEDVNN